jgi:hypothetical protein
MSVEGEALSGQKGQEEQKGQENVTDFLAPFALLALFALKRPWQTSRD